MENFLKILESNKNMMKHNDKVLKMFNFKDKISVNDGNLRILHIAKRSIVARHLNHPK